MTLNITPMRFAGASLAFATLVTAGAVAAGATLFTTAFILAACATPVAVMMILGFGGRPLTVAELLHAVNTEKERRS